MHELSIPYVNAVLQLTSFQSIFLLALTLGIIIIIPSLAVFLIKWKEYDSIPQLIIVIVVPLIVVPAIIISFRIFRDLLYHFKILKHSNKITKLKKQSFRQSLQTFMNTSKIGVYWVN